MSSCFSVLLTLSVTQNGNAFDVVPAIFPTETRDVLCRQYNELPESLRERKLDDELSASVEHNLIMCLYFSMSSQERITVASKHSDVNEAEARRGWDGLHALGFAGAGDVAYPGDKFVVPHSLWTLADDVWFVGSSEV